MSEIRVKASKPLPEPLPEGERVLWQRSPSWKPYSRRVFQIDKIALYFLLIIAWVAISAWWDSQSTVAVARALTWSLPPALGVLGLLATVAWLYARTSVYTITNKRVIIQSGLALDTYVNLPYSKVASADLKSYRDGTGDIDIHLQGPRLLYSMVWPNLRWLQLKRPTPVLRALEEPETVAKVLGDALASDQPAEHKSSEQSHGRERDLGQTATSS